MRQQHYRFAHQVLAAAVLQNPEGWWAAAPVHGVGMLQQAWAAAGEGLGPENLADGSALQLAPLSPAPGVDAIVITLPPPQEATECYFAALVRVAGSTPRYFVCERGFDAEGGVPRAYWAEWRYGPGGSVMRIRGQDLPQITPEALIAAAAEECRGAAAAAPGGAAPGAGMPFPPGGGMPYSPGGGMPYPPGGGMPYPAGAGGPPAPARKSRVALFVGMGCLSIVALFIAFGAWLFYQESGRGLHVPDDEVASTPVEPGKPFVVRFKWEGVGWAFNNVWLVVDDGKKSGGSFKITGTLTCGRSGTINSKIDTGLAGREVHRKEDKGADGFSAWIYLGDEYARSSDRTIECGGVIEPTAGKWTKARVVVTQRQRPGDFIAR